MQLVTIRKEVNYYLAYFLELRRLLVVNSQGARIIDYFFNKDYSQDQIAARLGTAQSTVVNFLKEVKNELQNQHAGGYPLIFNKPLKTPLSVELQINTRCNLRCRHCFQSRYDKLMPLEKVKKILKLLYEAKVVEIKLVGGEVFLRPDFFEILSLCEDYNFVIDIITNATLLTDELIERLAQIRNLALLVSLEGVGEANDKIRGKGVFRKVDKVIRKLKEKGIYVEISTTLNAENVGGYKNMVEYCQKLGVPCNLNLFKPLKESHPALILKPEKYFEVAKEVFETPRSTSRVTSAAIIAELQGTSRDECRATLIGLTVDVDGKMVPCPILQAAGYYANVKLPDFDENFEQVWQNHPLFQKFRQVGFRECQARAYIFSGDVRGKDPYGIDAFRKYCRRRKKAPTPSRISAS